MSYICILKSYPIPHKYMTTMRQFKNTCKNFGYSHNLNHEFIIEEKKLNSLLHFTKALERSISNAIPDSAPCEYKKLGSPLLPVSELFSASESSTLHRNRAGYSRLCLPTVNSPCNHFSCPSGKSAHLPIST
jgi:hypothetical protein